MSDDGPWVMLQCGAHRHPIIEIQIDQGGYVWWGCDGDEDTAGTINGDQEVVSSATKSVFSIEEVLETPEDSRLRFTCPTCRAQSVETENRLRVIYTDAVSRRRSTARLD